MDEPRTFLTVPEVASLIGASPERTYALVAAGAIPSVRFGRRVRIPRPAFDRWVADLSERALAEVTTDAAAK